MTALPRRWKANVRVAELRLANQRLVGSTFAEPADAARSLLAMQAQDFAGAKWSIGLRVPRATDADVERALAKAQIVRSWPMRGTLHFTHAADLKWLLAVSTPKMLRSTQRRRDELELDDRALGRAREVAEERLSGGKNLSREELLLEFSRAGISVESQRGYHILYWLAQTGTLVFGPTRNKEQTFVLLDEWVKESRQLDVDEALGELARRYFSSHGPATLEDLVAWAKLTLGDAKRGLSIARPSLVELSVDGIAHFMDAEAEAVLSKAEAVKTSVLALPGFDEYVLGYRGRGAVLAPDYSERICPGGNGVFMPTIVAAGEVVGTWRRSTRAKQMVVLATPFTKLTAAVARRFERAAESYGRFLGVPVAFGR